MFMQSWMPYMKKRNLYAFVNKGTHLIELANQSIDETIWLSKITLKDQKKIGLKKIGFKKLILWFILHG